MPPQNQRRGFVEIPIGGEVRPLKFGHNTAAKAEEHGGAVTRLHETPTRVMLILIWAALSEGARVTGKDFYASIPEVGDWLDEVDEDELDRAIETWKSTHAKAQPETEGNAPERKRKSRKASSTP